MSQARSGLEVTFTPGYRLDAEQVDQEVDVGELLVRRSLQSAIQYFRRLSQSELLKVQPRLFQGDHRGVTPAMRS